MDDAGPLVVVTHGGVAECRMREGEEEEGKVAIYGIKLKCGPPPVT